MAVEAEYWEVLTPGDQPNQSLPVLPWTREDQVKAHAVNKFGRKALAVRLNTAEDGRWSFISHPDIVPTDQRWSPPKLVVTAEQSNADKANHLRQLSDLAIQYGFELSQGTDYMTKSRKPLHYIKIGYQEQ